MARQFGEDINTVMRLKQSMQNEEEAAYKFFMENKDTLCSVDNLGSASKVMRQQLESSRLKNDRCVRAFKEAEDKRKNSKLDLEKMAAAAASQAPRDGAKLPMINFMRPVPPAIRKTLYDGISATGGGRARYLKLRNVPGPEEKFNIKYPTSWDYGWHFGELMKLDEVKKPFNHCSLLENTFYSRNGVPMEDIVDVIQKKRFA